MSEAINTHGYSPHPSITLVQNTLAAMKERTGRTLEEWLDHVKAHGPSTEAEQRDWLKGQGLGTNYAWWIAERANGRGREDTDPEAYLRAAVTYVDAMYAGGKEGLRPIHDALIRLARAVAEDIRICPCQTMVPFFREHVIARIKPASRKRIDFGLALRDTPAKGRLMDTGGFAKKDRITHRIIIESVEQVDDGVCRWLKAAYDLDGPKSASAPRAPASDKGGSKRVGAGRSAAERVRKKVDGKATARSGKPAKHRPPVRKSKSTTTKRSASSAARKRGGKTNRSKKR